ncbi:lipopolysaccharide-induced tumor necrosis factor-alpha factor homolog [Dendronephthya gigantea]|uniref:lipopolysaccharide-induced tumor necrosis factor-alpha factor homolog n=1 Tax=Dendronephthya gigantea TaxID=151771 RepID=UPI00106C8156|nr:lipopolysaccharide-induced tumor necrosis factor-alpha factor homolog [Dendronephthya gigantea]
MATLQAETTEKMQPPSYEASQEQVASGQNVVSTTVVTQPPVMVQTVMTPLMFGPTPINMVCSHCGAQIVTATSYEPGILTWLFCGGIAVVGCWLGCCLIPFCIDDIKDCRHTCPNCQNFLGVYRRI